ncbi:peptidase, partial [Bacillus pseudomycoides]
MKKSNKYLTAVALCSTIMIGGLQVPAVSYAATNEKVDDIKPDTKLLKSFQKELKKHIDNREENITITYKTKAKNGREVMDTLYKEYTKIVDADEYLKYNVASTKYSIRGIPENYTFTLKIT